MTKKDFLGFLEHRLQILNKKERDDILEEYAQHIELKIGSGLSEEESIRDFGEMEELVAEILDAYNVNPDYQKELKNPPMELVKAWMKRSCLGLKKEGAAVWQTVCRGTAWIDRICSGAITWCEKKLRMIGSTPVRAAGIKSLETAESGEDTVSGLGFEQNSLGEDGNPVTIAVQSGELLTNAGSLAGEAAVLRRPALWKRREPSITQEKGRPALIHNFGDMMAGMGRGILRMCSGIWQLTKWCLWFCFRLLVICALAPFALLEMFTLALMGVLIVMAVLGYPVIGIMIGTFGSLICGGAFVWFIWDLFIAKKDSGKKKEIEVIPEPVNRELITAAAVTEADPKPTEGSEQCDE